MHSNVFASSLELKYFQVLGIHPRKEKHNLFLCFQLGLLFIVILNCFAAVSIFPSYEIIGSTLFFLGVLDEILLSIAVGSSIFCAMISTAQNTEIMQNLRLFDDIVEQMMKTRKFNKSGHQTNLYFILFCAISFGTSLAVLFTSPMKFTLQFFYFASQRGILNHIVHISMYRVFILLKAVQRRLEIISLEFEESTKQDLKNLRLSLYLKTCIINLNDISDQLKNHMKFLLSFNITQLFFVTMTNINWLLVSYIGLSFTNSFDALISTVPSTIIIVGLALIDLKSKKLFRKVLQIIATNKTSDHGMEERLLLMFHCKFSNLVFGAFDISFETVGEVLKTFLSFTVIVLQFQLKERKIVEESEI